MPCKAAAVPAVAVKLEDGGGVTAPKLKPVLRKAREVKKDQTPKAQYCPFNITFYNSFI